MNQSPETKDLYAALCKAQALIKGAVKDSSNPFFKSKYADLESVWDACRGPLTSNGLSVVQTTEYTVEAGVCLVTTLAHASGQWVKGSLPIMAKQQDPQGIGSAITYARRYALAAIVGITQTDDDGESAMARRRIAPEQPAEGDGHNVDLGYRIPFGKFMKRALEDIEPNQLISYIDFLESSATKKNQPITGQVKEFIERASAYLAAMERQGAAELRGQS